MKENTEMGVTHEEIMERLSDAKANIFSSGYSLDVNISDWTWRVGKHCTRDTLMHQLGAIRVQERKDAESLCYWFTVNGVDTPAIMDAYYELMGIVSQKKDTTVSNEDAEEEME